jgi:hypothetical protein
MSTINPYFSHGTRNEQYIVEDLIIECLKIYGNEVMYIPRQLVSKDEILGEDRLSKFKHAYPIEMYFENVDSFDGQGAFMSKFGLMIEQSATLVVARRRWDQMIGRYDTSILPNRPAEGDLIYFPLTSGLFEIKFVKHQDPFYQLGKLYVYKLHVELFQYASERLDTCISDIDMFESLKTFDVNATIYGKIDTAKVVSGGQNYTTASCEVISNTGQGAILEPVITNGIITSVNIVKAGQGYRDGFVRVIGDGSNATVDITLMPDIDKPDSYGDNNSFKREAESFVFNDRNPFGEVDPD